MCDSSYVTVIFYDLRNLAPHAIGGYNLAVKYKISIIILLLYGTQEILSFDSCESRVPNPAGFCVDTAFRKNKHHA